LHLCLPPVTSPTRNRLLLCLLRCRI